jgi:DNA modification methylase
MSLEYRIGDVFDELAKIPDGSIDLIVTSPPFLALRSYLPADHPDKGKEIGSEATPAAFIDTLLALSAEWGRVLAPHGSLCVELGDTYSGSGGAGGDYAAGGLRDGQEAFDGSAKRRRTNNDSGTDDSRPGSTGNDGGVGRQSADGGTHVMPSPPGGNGRASMTDKAPGGHHMGGNGWPLAKSLTGIPTIYPWSLAYGRNLLTGQPSPAGQWRIRNVIVWARPNPPVGALGDKFRPATSYITVACKSAKRYFDLDAVRTEHLDPRELERFNVSTPSRASDSRTDATNGGDARGYQMHKGNPAGAPPLDWHSDMPDEDGDWLWKLSTQPYSGSHYATFPMALPKRLIEAMCPLRVCAVCGRPSERIVEADRPANRADRRRGGEPGRLNEGRIGGARIIKGGAEMQTTYTTLGWSDCGHDNWRTGNVLDPFAGSGTTLEAAQAVGRHAIGIDLDQRNADLARSRVGMFLEVAS